MSVAQSFKVTGFSGQLQGDIDAAALGSGKEASAASPACNLTRARANALLVELQTGYSAKSFQQKLQKVLDQATSDGLEHADDLAARWQLTKKVYADIFARYGCSQDGAGLAQLTSVLQPVQDAFPEFTKKVNDIYQALRLKKGTIAAQDLTTNQQTKQQLEQQDGEEARVEASGQHAEEQGELAAIGMQSLTDDIIDKEKQRTLSLETASTTLPSSPLLGQAASSFDIDDAPFSQLPIAMESDDTSLEMEEDDVSCVPSLVPLSQPRALALQTELLAAFSAPRFQKKLSELSREHNAMDTISLEYRAAFRKLVRSKQLEIIQRYGFDASEQGVQDMLIAFQQLDDDPDVYVNSVAIDEALHAFSSREKSKAAKETQPAKWQSWHGLKNPASVKDFLKKQLIVFSRPAFQRIIRALQHREDWNQLGKRVPDGYYHLDGRQEVAFRFQQILLPRYGLDATPAAMREAISMCSKFLADPEVANLFDEVNAKLGMSPTACARFRRLAASLAEP